MDATKGGNSTKDGLQLIRWLYPGIVEVGMSVVDVIPPGDADGSICIVDIPAGWRSTNIAWDVDAGDAAVDVGELTTGSALGWLDDLGY